MKIVAAQGARLAVFLDNRIVRHRIVTAEGLYDAKIKAIIAPYFDAPDTDYYRKALANRDAVVVTDEPKAAPKRAGRAEE